ncbi:protein FAM81B [Hyla sarda]|uniref:protein FAM81B n=1 Tax=Hyla sarda TaxID=327740 RepID=UPI0024C3D74F|nr:protein FAM81B [Hyla sarda]XP_056393934.1 protein FAM81B [Hyla sarda]
MSRENTVQLVRYPDRGQSFLPAIPVHRVELLEDRLFNQEKTTTTLLDQAFKIKEDVAMLRGNRGHPWDLMAQRLLENHMQTVIQIVKQLGKDIEVLENEIRTRDTVSSGTSFAVQSLDRKHLAGIGDLRGRVARCDSSITKLSGDLMTTKQEVRAHEKELHNLSAALEARMKELDLKVLQLIGKMEASIFEQNNKVKNTQGEQHHEIQLLDFKLAGFLEDIQGQIQNQRKWAESQLERTADGQTQHIQQLINALRERMEDTEKRIQENVHHLTLKVDNTNQAQRLEAKFSKLKHTEDKMAARITKLESQIWDEIENMKSEYRAGFQAIQESLNSLQQIQETKVKLESRKFQKDIKQIRRKIVEIKDI